MSVGNFPCPVCQESSFPCGCSNWRKLTAVMARADRSLLERALPWLEQYRKSLELRKMPNMERAVTSLITEIKEQIEK